MKSSSWALLAIGLVFVLLSLSQIISAGNDLEIIKIPGSDPPTTIVAPSEAAGDLRPVVLVGHGFAGSELLMRGFSFSLAKAGYIVVAWDFDGHGRNPRPYLQDGTMDALLANAEAALETARTHSFVTSDRVAILGHSMGSGVALVWDQAPRDGRHDRHITGSETSDTQLAEQPAANGGGSGTPVR